MQHHRVKVRQSMSAPSTRNGWLSVHPVLARHTTIATVDCEFSMGSTVKLEDHTDDVRDIYLLHSALSTCITCSGDQNIEAWGC
jgi:hypothetical protein